MTLLTRDKSMRWFGGFLAVVLIAVGSNWLLKGQTPGSRIRVIARGAGITMLEGGSGGPDYMPVIQCSTARPHLASGHTLIEGEFEIVVELDGLDVLEGGESSDGFEAAVFDAPGGVGEGAAVGGDPVFEVD